MKNWPTRHNHGMASGPCPSIQQPQPHIPPILLHCPPETTHREPDMGSSSLLSDKGCCPCRRQIIFSTTIVECISFCLTCNVKPGSNQLCGLLLYPPGVGIFKGSMKISYSYWTYQISGRQSGCDTTYLIALNCWLASIVWLLIAIVFWTVDCCECNWGIDDWHGCLF